MGTWVWIAAGAAVVSYGAAVLVLVAQGRRADARAWAGFVPDAIVLFGRLMGDARVPRARRVLLGAMLGYLAMPFDLVPDFLPVVGQLDDAIVVAAVLRGVLRAAGEGPIREHWPGPEASLRLVMRLAGGRSG
jgi:uncharacterized membrane protein YkvA (DUF1232 family)